MANSFSHNTNIEARAKVEAEKNGEPDHVSKPANREPKISGDTMIAPVQANVAADEQALVAKLVAAIEEEPATQTPVDESATSKDDAQQADKQDSEPELSETERADSDVDMQADSKNDSDSANASQTEIHQGKTRQLDDNLLETIKPGDATQKTDSDTVRAIDIAYSLPSDSSCVIPGDNQYPRVGVHYRPNSFAIKGRSLTNIDKLIAVYKKCGGKLLVVDNKVDKEASDNNLVQLRQNEVKYYLLQRRVPKDDMVFPDI